MKKRHFLPFLIGLIWISSFLVAETLIYRIETNHSTVGFSVPIFGGFSRVSGKFNDVDVEIRMDEEDLSGSSVLAVLQVSSIDTGIKMRDTDLQGPLFFDAAIHPEIRFKSKQIEKRADGQYLAVGDLTIKGVTREVQFPFELRIHSFEEGRKMLGVTIRTELNRLDYGVGEGWEHTSMENFLGETIAVEIDLWTRAGSPL